MIRDKVREYISFVVYLHNCADSISSFLDHLYLICEDCFSKYEVILVDDASTDGTIDILKCGVSQTTLVKLSVYHGLEMAMNAGVDIAVGDYVYEIDSTDIDMPLDLIYDAYQKAVEGNDIVTVNPSDSNFLNKCFYSVFNKNSRLEYPIRTDIFRVVSRRAINRVHSISEYLPYRKAAYAASGLRQDSIKFLGGGIQA